jgi:YggT family protein
VGYYLSALLGVYLYILIARLIIDYVMMFSRTWIPTGFVAVLVDGVFRLTDPPLKFLRRFVPNLRLGSVSLVLSFLVLLIGIQIVQGLVIRL